MLYRELLRINPEPEMQRIGSFICEMTRVKFKRGGVVIGLSGGIDSAVVAELCVRALGKEHVLGLLLPEKESSLMSLEYGKKQAQKMGIDFIEINITPFLESLNVYQERNKVIKEIFSEFQNTFRFQVTLPQDILEKDRINYHILTIEDEEGNRKSKRLSAKEWLRISACQNIKQRIRMIMLYHYAEKNNYLVAGTTNKTEAVQGFYVKFGDGGVDIEPIAHLYKTQVYQLARHLGVIEEIINRTPSPDTYSLPVSDKEFYFCLDYELLDLLLYAYLNRIPAEHVMESLKLSKEQVERVFRDFEAKERATWHLRQMPPSLVEHFTI